MNELIKKVILNYDWKLAIKNWLLGAVGGAVTAFGFGNVV
jgi:hypothetical protein